MATPFNQSIICPAVIGRNAQLTVLTRAFEGVARGQGQTLLLSGEAGIGKSRLVSEAKGIALRCGWRIVEGHCFETDRVLPYAPLLDLLRTQLASLSSADIEALFGPEARDLIKVLPELGRKLSGITTEPSFDPAQERRLAIQAVTAVILRLAGYGPVLVVIEDLHWSDDTSREALLHLARGIRNTPILLLLTYRDEEVTPELSHALATIDRERLAYELPLQRLTVAEVGAMLNAIFAGASPVRGDALDALHALTDGNPFFIEEILGTIIRGDRSPGSPEQWDRLSLDAPEEPQIPRSVQDAVQRRVERLTPDARRLLELTAVAGRRFDFSLLQSLTGQDEAELLGLVKELIAAQLLIEESEDRFAFRHALTREAVYSQLLSRERRRLHQTIAEALEELNAVAEELPLAELAYHFYAAGEWQPALDYASRAGERALALYAPRAAIEQFSRALDAAKRLARRPAPEVYRNRGRSYEMIGDFESARADYEASLAIARTTQDQRAEWQALLDLGLLWAERDYERTSEYSQRALALARTMADPGNLAQSLNRVGNWYTNLARPDQGLALHREALSIAETADDLRLIAETLELLGIACYVSGNPSDAADYYSGAIDRFRELDDRQAVVWCLSVLALFGGNYQTDAGAVAPITLERCGQYAHEAIGLSREIGWRPGEAFAQHVDGIVQTSAGRYDRAFDLIGRGLTLAQEIGHRQWALAGTVGLGVLHLELLNPHLSRHYSESALADARSMGSRLWLLTTSAVLAAACLLDRDLDAAQVVLDAADLRDIPQSAQGARSCWMAYAELYLARGNAAEALRIADELVATDPHLTEERASPCLARLHGEALTSLRRLDEAEASLRAAVDGALKQGRPAHRWRAQIALGRVLRLQRRHAEADAAFADARETIEALAATVPDEVTRQGFLTAGIAMLPRPRQLTARKAAIQAYGGLTERELEVAALVAHGLSNRTIAERLIVSEPTVATHVSHVLSKLGYSSRTQVATWAVEVGLLNDG
jgi:DNA-binding CsgD family transcriptional regulator